MPKFTTCVSRDLAQRLDPKDFPEKTCIISINEPFAQDGFAKLSPKWYKIYRTHFWDVTKRLEVGIALAGHPNEPIDPMTEEQAKQMANFIKANWDCSILVHCRAGISRSAAVARVLMELGWEDFHLGRTNVDRANVHVVSLLKQHFPQLLPLGAENGGSKDNNE